MSEVKQVILIRKDLKMGKGKIASQASHACMSVFFKCLSKTKTPPKENTIEDLQYASYWSMPNLPYFEEYITGAFTKAVVSVDSEEELLKYYRMAMNDGIYASLIRDAGKTEFNNIPTNTAVAIGPWEATEIDQITGHLKLL
jgi:PTH2 family peptidyl-tRNA hydrolase